MDIREIGEDIIISVELPGLTKDDIKLEYNNGILSINGERKQPDLKENETVFRRERVWGKFYRTIRLPDTVKDADISANFDNGVLEVKMPHGKEVRAEKKSIAIS
jgi:HSP20 family protein